MTCDVAVTFEFEMRPPQTVRLKDVTASGVHTIAARALRIARGTAKPIGWTSISVLLDRQGTPTEKFSGDTEIGGQV